MKKKTPNQHPIRSKKNPSPAPTNNYPASDSLNGWVGCNTIAFQFETATTEAASAEMLITSWPRHQSGTTSWSFFKQGRGRQRMLQPTLSEGVVKSQHSTHYINLFAWTRLQSQMNFPQTAFQRPRPHNYILNWSSADLPKSESDAQAGSYRRT